MNKTKFLLSILLPMLILSSGCAVSDQVASDIVDNAYELIQEDDVYVEAIKSATMQGYGCTYGQAFSHFFAYPKWKHFTSDTGYEIVEFTGDCLYDEQTVKALIQFTITNQNGNYIEWEATYLSFNNVTQNLLMLSELLDTAAREYAS